MTQMASVASLRPRNCLVWTLAGLLFTSCAGAQPKYDALHVIGVLPSSSQLAAQNATRIRHLYGHEWTFRLSDSDRSSAGPHAPTRPRYGSEEGRLPDTCVALSGGGIRSTAFSSGVLKALADAGLGRRGTTVDHVDIISAASGGAYALSWYYAQHSRGFSSEEIFSDKLDELAATAAFVPPAPAGAHAVISTTLIPANLLFNGLYGLKYHTNVPLYSFYERRIHESFHNNTDLSISDLAEIVRRKDLPLPIFVTSAFIDDDGGQVRSRLANRVFEFTPLRYGSDAFGYATYTETRNFKLKQVVAMSGAAVDSTRGVGAIRQTLLSLLNIGLGRWIPNFGPHDQRTVAASVVPLLYLQERSSNRGPEGTSIYVTDGGHTDNLAVFPLVKRLCRWIIVADAEHDPEYRFNGYFVLKNALRSEMHVELGVGPIDCTQGRLELRRSERDSGVVLPVAQSDPRCANSAVTPIMEGRIRSFPYASTSSGAPATRDIHVTYVKLFVQPGRLDDYPLTVKCYFNLTRRQNLRDLASRVASYVTPELSGRLGELPEEAEERMRLRVEAALNGIDLCSPEPSAGTVVVPSEGINGCKDNPGFLEALNCTFPQETTGRQEFSELQFRAYCDLGYASVMQHIKGTRTIREGCGPDYSEAQLTVMAMMEALRQMSLSRSVGQSRGSPE